MVFDVNIVQYLPDSILFLVIATALGLFIGLEREWSEKPAGIRTFSIVSLIGASLTLIENDGLLLIGGIAIIAVTVLLGVDGLLHDDVSYGLSITTSMSLLLTFLVGVIVGYGYIAEAATITAISSALLVLKRELHSFAGNLSKEEIKSGAEFAIIAFVAFQFIPSEPVGPNNSIDLQTVWLLVIAISAIGFVNYIFISEYGHKGFAVTGFFGGLVNSTAVIGEVTSRYKNGLSGNMAIGAILLANSAMSLRNAALLLLFLPAVAPSLILPLLCITVAGIALAYYVTPWGEQIDVELESPFSTKNAIMFGGLFLLVLVISTIASQQFGEGAFIVTIALAGAVSSGTAIATIITLLTGGQLTMWTAMVGVVVSVISSMIVKIVLISSANNTTLIKQTIFYTAALIIAGAIPLGIFIYV